mgnify:CR=1 FL=1
MKKNVDGEKIALVIVVIIILIIIGYILYTVFISNKHLRNNSSINENIQQKTMPNIPNSDNNQTKYNKNNIDNIKNEENEFSIIEEKKEEIIATFSTSIYDKDENRVSNITLANSKLNGTIVKNGEEFSFNNTIGPMNEEQGFKKALGFDSKGKKIQISGGGLCQISSTLYNAALIANLNVTERHPHSRRVYYVPQDKDATIVYGSLDFKFINNSGSDIKIQSTNDSSTVTVNLIKMY